METSRKKLVVFFSRNALLEAIWRHRIMEGDEFCLFSIMKSAETRLLLESSQTIDIYGADVIRTYQLMLELAARDGRVVYKEQSGGQSGPEMLYDIEKWAEDVRFALLKEGLVIHWNDKLIANRPYFGMKKLLVEACIKVID